MLGAGSTLALAPQRLLASALEGGAPALPEQVRFYVPSPPGGAPDLVARALAEELARLSPLRPAIHNVDGANGEIALARFRAEAADGASWLVAQDSVIVINPSFYPRATADALDGLTPIGGLARNSFLLLVAATDPIQGLDDLVVASGRAPQPLFYGSGGVGSQNHVAMQELADRLAVSWTHVPYRGNSLAVQGLLRGDVRLLLAGGSAIPLMRAGRVRVLAVGAQHRLPAWPDLPTLSERVPGFAAEPWFGLFGQDKTPAPMLAQMRELVRQAAQSPVYAQRLHDAAAVRAEHVDGAALAARVHSERAHFAALISRWPPQARQRTGDRQ